MSHYDAASVENKWLNDKEWSNAFNKTYDIYLSKKPFQIFQMIMPPPNITSILHLGHALTLTIQDTICRYQRYMGNKVNWIPGLDHAGIATQNVVEKYLLKHNKPLDHLVDEIWQWKNQYGDDICKQIKLLGVSCNWNEQYFTLDSARSKSVNHAFKKLYEKELIYRADRVINWSCLLKTAISDVEVDTKLISEQTYFPVPNSQETVEFGVMHYIIYQIENSLECLTISTTRPETIFADVAVAVNPNDQRYKHLIGKKLMHPYCANRNMIVIADEIAQPEKGFGCVKISPAHDKDDFECSKRHKLPSINILNADGTLNSVCKQFEGINRLVARKQIIEDLKHKQLYKGKDNHEMAIKICSRSGDFVEPMLTKQWFMKMSDMAQKANDLVRQNQIVILPEMHKKTWHNWLSTCEDWCISRQLLWGHKIPAYHCISCEPDNWICKIDINPVCIICQKLMQQSTDVLDTWFSSALLPLSVKNWPNKPDNTEYDCYTNYTTDLLETGSDILFFWVARMVMLCVELTDQIPFKQVLFHTMVRDKYGAKMSKTTGNVIDPVDLIQGANLDELQQKIKNSNVSLKNLQSALAYNKKEYPDGIKACGADALRFCLLSYASYTDQINLDINQLYSCKHMCDKIWQATKYIQIQYNKLNKRQIEELESYDFENKDCTILLSSRWIFDQLDKLCNSIHSLLNEYKLSQITKDLYQFLVKVFCDIYIEISKQEFVKDEYKVQTCACLFMIFESFLQILHPVMPFITEECNEILSNMVCPGKKVIALQQTSKIQRDFIKQIKHNFSFNVECTFDFANQIKTAFTELQAVHKLTNKKINKLLIQTSEISMIFNRQECDSICQYVSNNLKIHLHVIDVIDEDSKNQCIKLFCRNASINVYFACVEHSMSTFGETKMILLDLLQTYYNNKDCTMDKINANKITQIMTLTADKQNSADLSNVCTNFAANQTKNIQCQINKISDNFGGKNQNTIPRKIQTKLDTQKSKMTRHIQLQDNLCQLMPKKLIGVKRATFEMNTHCEI